MTVSRVALRRLACTALVASGTLVLFARPGWAQQPTQQHPVTLTGKVTSAEGAPLGQATVLVQDMNAGTTTRPDGSYTLVIPGARVPSGPVTVTARLVGFKPSAAQVDLCAGARSARLHAGGNPLQLGEMVVTGAGTVRGREARHRPQLRRLDRARAQQRAQHRERARRQGAEREVTSSSGDPGASSFIQVRGSPPSRPADGQPLFVVDGVPVDNSINYNNPANGALNASAAPPNRAIDINPDDIANVEILKGAASGAIYGSRAGQGVILITTKHGQARARPGTRCAAPSRWTSTPSFPSSSTSTGSGPAA